MGLPMTRLLPCLALLALAGAASMRPHAAQAADLAGLVQQLAADDFDGKEAAIAGLATLGDPRAVRILRALDAGSLYVMAPAAGATGDDSGTAADAAPDDAAADAASASSTAGSGSAPAKLVVATATGDACETSDPLSGARLGTVACDTLDQIVVNNRLRQDIAAALGRLTLFSDSPAERLAAAREAVRNPSAGETALLARALAGENDPGVRAALAEALAAARLSAGTKEEQVAAIRTLAGSADSEVFGLLSKRLTAADLDPQVRRTLQAALDAIGRRLRLVGLVQTLFQGLSLGSVLLLAAIGLAITFGVMGVINMAHGEMIMLGAYTTYLVQQGFRALLPAGWFDAYLIAAVPAAFLLAGSVGVLLERGIIRFLYGRPLETLLATWGVSLILQQAVRTLFGAPNKEVSNPSWMTGSVELFGSATITWNHLVILGFCFVVLGALVLLLRRTAFGLHMRAVTQNRDMAAAMGIATARIDALTFGLGSGIAGMAGVALSQIGNVSPNLGSLYIVDSFLVVVFGGVGNLAGTLVAALTLGVANKLLEPLAGAVLGKIAVLLFIILFIQKRPRGLFALKGRAAEA